MWDRMVVEKIECVGAYFLACSFRNVDDNFEWAFTDFYGPNADINKRVLRDELARLLSW
jgi:hypothetical protein